MKEVHGWFTGLWNHMVSQILPLQRDNVDGYIQSLCHSQNFHMVALHRHSLHLLHTKISYTFINFTGKEILFHMRLHSGTYLLTVEPNIRCLHKIGEKVSVYLQMR